MGTVVVVLILVWIEESGGDGIQWPGIKVVMVNEQLGMARLRWTHAFYNADGQRMT